MRKILLRFLIAIALLAVLLFVVVLALPARLIWDNLLVQQTPQLQIQGVSGQWWRGQAANVNWYQQSIGQLRWASTGTSMKLNLNQPLASLAGELDLVAVANSQLSMSEVEGELDASLLPDVLQQSLQTVGTIDLRLLKIQVEKDLQLNIDGTATWKNAFLRGDIALNLGQVNVKFTPDGQHTQMQILNQESTDLRIDGSGELYADRYNVQLRLRALPNRPQLQQQLKQLGRITSDGSVLLDIAGRF